MKSKITVAVIAMIIAFAGKAQPTNNAIFLEVQEIDFSEIKNLSAPI